eukprot:jgi/Chlat1/2740/Chrsp187S02927
MSYVAPAKPGSGVTLAYGGVRKASKPAPKYAPAVTHFLPGVLLGAIATLWANSGAGGGRGRTTGGGGSSSQQASSRGPPAVAGQPINSTWSGPVPAEGTDMKMVFVVRKDLEMGTGKIAAQVAHAVLGLYAKLQSRHQVLLRRWEDGGQAKVVLACADKKEMLELARSASSKGLPTHIVADAGRTQVAAGSETVLAIGPGAKHVIDSVTGHLKLL